MDRDESYLDMLTHPYWEAVVKQVRGRRDAACAGWVRTRGCVLCCVPFYQVLRAMACGQVLRAPAVQVLETYPHNRPPSKDLRCRRARIATAVTSGPGVAGTLMSRLPGRTGR